MCWWFRVSLCLSLFPILSEKNCMVYFTLSHLTSAVIVGVFLLKKTNPSNKIIGYFTHISVSFFVFTIHFELFLVQMLKLKPFSLCLCVSQTLEQWWKPTVLFRMQWSGASWLCWSSLSSVCSSSPSGAPSDRKVTSSLHSLNLWWHNDMMCLTFWEKVKKISKQ